MSHTALYRFFDVEGTLLYVGITHRLNQRITEHRKEKPWVEVAHVSIEHFDTRDEALAAEARAIRDEGPKWNVVLNGRRTSVSPRSYRAVATRQWSDAEWIAGVGRYASVALCRVTTVQLFDVFDAARQAWEQINRTACGGFCVRGTSHRVYDLETMEWVL